MRMTADQRFTLKQKNLLTENRCYRMTNSVTDEIQFIIK